MSLVTAVYTNRRTSKKHIIPKRVFDFICAKGMTARYKLINMIGAKGCLLSDNTYGCAFLHAPGDFPNFFLNDVLKLFSYLYPSVLLISLRVFSVFSRRYFPFSSLSYWRYLYKPIPKSFLKPFFNLEELKATCFAISGIV